MKRVKVGERARKTRVLIHYGTIFLLGILATEAQTFFLIECYERYVVMLADVAVEIKGEKILKK